MKSHEIKIVFFGTPEFALPSLKALIQHGYEHEYEIVALIANPDKPTGREQILTLPPTKIYAEKHNIPVFQPVKLAEEFQKEIPDADMYIIAAYGKIIPQNILDIPKFGVLNIHPSILPRWRGPSPIQYTILHDDRETGVTIMKTDARMDHGPILAQRKFLISKSEISKITYTELHDKLAKLGAELLIETLPKWIAGEIAPITQDENKETYSKILKKDNGRIDWKKSAEEIERMVRAFNPWPGTWTLWPTDKKIMRLLIETVRVENYEPPEGAPGFIWQNSHGEICVKTGHGSLILKKITPAGKKMMTTDAFCRGYKNFIGSNFI